MPHFTRPIDEMYTCLITAAKTYEAKFGSIDPVLETYIAFISSEIHNFMLNVEQVVKKPTEMERHCSTLQMSAFMALRNVKSLTDFQHWEHQAGRYLDSTPVMSQAPSSLEGMFV
jgi:glutaredoxin 2